MSKTLNKPSFRGSCLSGIPVWVLLKHMVTGIESKISCNSRQLAADIHCASQPGHGLCRVPKRLLFCLSQEALRSLTELTFG